MIRSDMNVNSDFYDMAYYGSKRWFCQKHVNSFCGNFFRFTKVPKILIVLFFFSSKNKVR